MALCLFPCTCVLWKPWLAASLLSPAVEAACTCRHPFGKLEAAWAAASYLEARSCETKKLHRTGYISRAHNHNCKRATHLNHPARLASPAAAAAPKPAGLTADSPRLFLGASAPATASSARAGSAPQFTCWVATAQGLSSQRRRLPAARPCSASSSVQHAAPGPPRRWRPWRCPGGLARTPAAARTR